MTWWCRRLEAPSTGRPALPFRRLAAPSCNATAWMIGGVLSVWSALLAPPALRVARGLQARPEPQATQDRRGPLDRRDLQGQLDRQAQRGQTAPRTLQLGT